MAKRNIWPALLFTLLGLGNAIASASDVILSKNFNSPVLIELGPHCGGVCDNANLAIVERTGDIGTVTAFANAVTGDLELTSKPDFSGTETFEITDGLTTFFIVVDVAPVGSDTPFARDDHYSEFPTLEINEDSAAITFDVLANDNIGNEPTQVVSVGTTIIALDGNSHAWRSTSRDFDPYDQGLITAINGEVSCAYENENDTVDCISTQTPGTTIVGTTAGPSEIAYQPGANFNGEDSFVYCMRDSQPSNDLEPEVFDPRENDVRCATVTINVLPVNDAPTVDENISYVVSTGDDLVIIVSQGLRLHVQDLDNTQLDGFGCDPLATGCVSTGDTLYFNLPDGATTAHGQVENLYANGAFVYSHFNKFTGIDSFNFEVCDADTSGEPAHCATGTVSIQVVPLAEAPTGSVDSEVELVYQLAETPLELPIGPEANVLILSDDSGSMGWEITTQTGAEHSGFELPDGWDYLYLYPFGKTFSIFSPYYISPPEADTPGYGLWRVRSSEFNTIYYNPLIRYDPWTGTNAAGAPYPQSDPGVALLDPNGVTTIDLTATYSYTAQGYGEVPCWTNCEESPTVIAFTNIEVETYIPRYYKWTDHDEDGELDAEPSPIGQSGVCADGGTGGPGCSEGQLVLINGDGAVFPRTAGRTDCLEDPCTLEEELDNFANWFTYSRSRTTLAKSALGRVVANAAGLRIGYATINAQSITREVDGETVSVVPQPIRSMNGSIQDGPKKDLLDSIYLSKVKGGTPLRSALRNAGRHFECKADDVFGSAADSSPGDEGCPISPAPAGNCQQNYALLITDGGWNGNARNGTETYVGDTDISSGNGFDGGAFAGSSDRDTLADVAMYFYERDLHPDLVNEVPTTAIDRNLADATAFEDASDDSSHQHMKTFALGFGVQGLIDSDPSSYSVPFNWGDPLDNEARKIDDLRHAAYNGRGLYLDAADASEIAERLKTAFTEFATGSGAGSAVSFNSQQVQTNTQIYRASYDTKTNSGNLVAHNFSEAGLGAEVWSAAEIMDETTSDLRKILTYDPDARKGIPFRADQLTLGQQAVFTNDGLIDVVNYLRGDDDLEDPVGDFRARPEVGGRLGDIVHSSPLFVGPPVQIDRSTEPYPQGDDAYSSFKVSHTNRSGVVYVAANDGMLHGFQADCNKEPSDSPPCAAAGEELFGYLPNNLILGGYSRNITGLLDPAYSHKFFVDLTPSVNDVFIDTGGSPGGRQWTTMLMGGHGAGGKAYFALDVTDPDLLTESNADKVVLWEFTDEDDSYPTVDGFPVTTSNGDQREDRGSPSKPVKDLGYAFSIPTIAMSNVKVLDASGENEWIAIFGNGYNSTAGIAKLFVLFVGRGVDGDWCHPDKIYNEGLINGSLPTGCVTGEQDFLKLDTTYGALPEVRDQDNNYVSGGLPNGLGTPRGIDIDGNGTLDYAYAGDTQGNFFRFDLSSSVYAEWNVTRIFKAAYAGVDQPITTRPIVTRHPTEPDGFIVIFSSGSYVSISDGYNTDVQSIYGIWDRLIENDFTNLAEMVRQNYTNVNSSTFGSVRTLSNHSVDYSAATPENPDGGKKGWFNHLDLPAAESVGSEAEFPGERAIRNIQLRGGFVFVNSVIPRSDQSCVDISGGFPLSFCPGTGGTDCFGDQGVFDLNNDGKFDVDDEVGGDVVAGGPMFESVPADSVFIGDKRITQLSNKEISIMSTNTGSGRYTGRLSWKQLDAIY